MFRRDVVAAAFSVAFLRAARAGATTRDNLASMRWRRRVLLVASPGSAEPDAVLQRRIFSAWSREAADRDVSLVEVSGSRVVGASDDAASLRRRYNLPSGMFQALLIGKDGHVACRSSRPITSAALRSRIDAMPMRRAGER